MVPGLVLGALVDDPTGPVATNGPGLVDGCTPVDEHTGNRPLHCISVGVMFYTWRGRRGARGSKKGCLGGLRGVLSVFVLEGCFLLFLAQNRGLSICIALKPNNAYL